MCQRCIATRGPTQNWRRETFECDCPILYIALKYQSMKSVEINLTVVVFFHLSHTRTQSILSVSYVI